MALTTKYINFTTASVNCFGPLTSAITTSAGFGNGLSFSRSISCSYQTQVNICSILYCVPSGRTAKVIPQYIKVIANQLNKQNSFVNLFVCGVFAASTPLTCAFPYKYSISVGTSYSGQWKLEHGNQRYNLWNIANFYGSVSHTNSFCKFIAGSILVASNCTNGTCVTWLNSSISFLNYLDNIACVGLCYAQGVKLGLIHSLSGSYSGGFNKVAQCATVFTESMTGGSIGSLTGLSTPIPGNSEFYMGPGECITFKFYHSLATTNIIDISFSLSRSGMNPYIAYNAGENLCAYALYDIDVSYIVIEESAS